MDYEAEKTITAESSPGEKLVWAGRPRRGLQFAASDIFVVPFSLAWCGLSPAFEMIPNAREVHDKIRTLR